MLMYHDGIIHINIKQVKSFEHDNLRVQNM